MSLVFTSFFHACLAPTSAPSAAALTTRIDTEIGNRSADLESDEGDARESPQGEAEAVAGTDAMAGAGAKAEVTTEPEVETGAEASGGVGTEAGSCPNCQEPIIWRSLEDRWGTDTSQVEEYKQLYVGYCGGGGDVIWRCCLRQCPLSLLVMVLDQ